MEYTAMEQYWIWLSSVEGIGPKKFYHLLSVYEDARGVWDALGGVPPALRQPEPGQLRRLPAPEPGQRGPGSSPEIIPAPQVKTRSFATTR